jgi:hypothetical protein
VRARSSGNADRISASAAGETKAAARPCAARGDEPRAVAGQRPEQGGQRERQHARDEGPPPAQQVRGAAAEEQEAAEQERVGVRHPRQLRGRQAQLRGDGRQRHADDRGVEDEHELRGRQQRQRQRRLLLALLADGRPAAGPVRTCGPPPTVCPAAVCRAAIVHDPRGRRAGIRAGRVGGGGI